MSDPFEVIDDVDDVPTAPRDETGRARNDASPPSTGSGLFSAEQSASLYRLVRDRRIGRDAYALYVGYIVFLFAGLAPLIALLISLLFSGTAAIAFDFTYNGQRTVYRSPEWVGYAAAALCAFVPLMLANAFLRASRVLSSLRRIAKHTGRPKA